MSNIHVVDTFIPAPDDNFFFDNNVWMYLYGPIADYKKPVAGQYSGFLKKILKAGSNIYISSLVLSEFFNTYARLEFNIRKTAEPSKYKDFKKDFRKTKDYRKVISDVAMLAENQILKISRRVSDEFSEIDIKNLFNKVEEYDFNDKYIMQLSALNNLKLVTDDSDFAKTPYKIEIITANKNLLKHM